MREGRSEEFVPLKDVSGCQGALDKRITVELRRPGAAVSATDLAAVEPVPDLPDSISFYPDGTADAAMILLQDRAGFRLGLKLNPITARVHVFELEHP